MIFDTHAHYDADRYIGEREQVLNEVFASGVGRVVDVGTTVESSELAVRLAGQFPGVYAAVGIHPEELKDADFAWLDRIEALAAKPKAESDDPDRPDVSAAPKAVSGTSDRSDASASSKVVAIGEIGLDYYWNKENKEEQAEWFVRQLELARHLDLPVIIHSRDAAADTFEIMKEAARLGSRGVMHCYSYSAELAREYVKRGFYLGIGGVLTYDNSRVLKEVVKEIPLEHLVLETDCPYLTPNPYRKKRLRNQSSYLPEVVKAIAQIKEIPPEEVEAKTWANACKLFGLMP